MFVAFSMKWGSLIEADLVELAGSEQLGSLHVLDAVLDEDPEPQCLALLMMHVPSALSVSATNLLVAFESPSNTSTSSAPRGFTTLEEDILFVLEVRARHKAPRCAR